MGIGDWGLGIWDLGGGGVGAPPHTNTTNPNTPTPK